MTPNYEDLQAEIALLKNENQALQQLLEVQEATIVGESRRLENALALLTREQRSLERTQQYEAQYDSLTGLPKRDAFLDRLEGSLHLASANPDYRFAVLSIGIDRFQLLNGSIGHVAGNELLKHVAQRLVSSLRVNDLVGRMECESSVARLGGDEFAVLLDNIKTVENASQISDRIQQSLTAPFSIHGREVFATAGIGLALSTSSYQSADEILRDANMAMCRAKARGKGRSQVFDSEMRANALVRWELETDLRHALEKKELRVYYQSKVVLATEKIAGFEALLRWEHPKRGLISPLQFIPIAEETGLIVEIGNWVLREACREVKQWNERFHPREPLAVSVNLSCCQFNDSALFDHIEAAVKETGFDPKLLSLEITETHLMGNTAFAVEVLGKLKSMGIGLMIDDFGTGYSSLNYLARFPFDTLKIDQSFVRAMDTGAEAVEIVKTMLALASNLGMDVVAEGIETATQLNQLRALGCFYGQGYLFSKPVSGQATRRMLAKFADIRRKSAEYTGELVGCGVATLVG